MANVTIQYTADIQQLNSKLDQIIQKQEQLGSSAKKAGADMSDAAKKAKSETDNLDAGIGRLTATIASAFAVSKIIDFTKSLISVERQMELLQNRLNFLAGGAEMGRQMFLRLEAASRRLGLNILDTAEGLASFGIAAKQAGFSAQKSEKIFIQVASGLRAAGASSLQTQRSFYALQQMMSKGVVAAEELRRQLGESLPGASDLMTKAYNRLHPAANLTNLEFTKLLETGKIISKDILPSFASVIEETFAPALAGKQTSLDAALNKVNNEILKLKLNIGNADWFKASANIIGRSLFELNAVLSSESLSTLDKIYASLFVGDPVKTQKTVDAFNMIQKAVAEYSKEVTQAITTNIVFGNALEGHSEKYKAMTEEERDLYKKKTDDEIEANRKIIKSSEELLKENDKLIEAKKKEFEESIKIATQGKTKIQAYAIEQKMLKDLSEEIRNITKNRTDEEKNAAQAASNAASRNEFLEASLIEFYNLDSELRKKSEDDKEAARKKQEQFLRDEVANAEAAVLRAQKGSIEEGVARANLADKQRELNEFMAKSDATMQLARLKGEIETNEKVEEARTKTADALSDIVVEEEIDPSKDPALKRIDKELETLRENADKIAEATAAPFMSAMDEELVAASSHYIDLIKLTEENSEERKRLEEALQQELSNIRQRYADKESRDLNKKIKKYAQAASQIVGQASAILTGYVDSERQMRENALEAEIQSLSSRFEAGVMGEEEYQKAVNAIKAEQFKIDQQAAISKIEMDSAAAIINLYAQLPFPAAALLTPVVAGLALAKIDAVKSTPMPTFHEGGIDIGKEARMTSGPLKSDEFIAKLQRGESVMTVKETSKYKDVLSAIRENRLPGLIADKYLIPAYKGSLDEPRKTISESTSLELAFQTAELVGAIKNNKRIKIDNVNELSKAINKRSSIDQVIKRRSW